MGTQLLKNAVNFPLIFMKRFGVNTAQTYDSPDEKLNLRRDERDRPDPDGTTYLDYARRFDESRRQIQHGLGITSEHQDGDPE